MYILQRSRGCSVAYELMGKLRGRSASHCSGPGRGMMVAWTRPVVMEMGEKRMDAKCVTEAELAGFTEGLGVEGERRTRLMVFT